MKIIKKGNQYGLVVSKQELLALASGLGMTYTKDRLERIKNKPNVYGTELPNRTPKDDRILFTQLSKALLNDQDTP